MFLDFDAIAVGDTRSLVRAITADDVRDVTQTLLYAKRLWGLLAAALAAVLALVTGRPVAAASAGLAFVLLVIWVLIYVRISAPINRRLTAAADAHQTPADARELQRRWDAVIVPRAALQGVAVLALALSLIA